MKHFKKIAITSSILAIFSAFSSAQQNTGKITAPTMPTMPTVPTPSIGDGFYTPSSSGFYSGNKSSRPQNTTQPKAPTAPTTPVFKKDNAAVSNNTNNAQTKTTASEIAKNSVLNSQLGSNQLTASDMSNLDSLGLLGSLSGILSSDSKNKINLGEIENQQKNAEILNKILDDIKEIKASVNSNAKAVSFDSSEKAASKVLRFSADNADYMQTLKTVYFSKQEVDGTFLLTGDLKYSIGGKAHNETFYLLFKSAGVEEGTTRYSVTASVTQDYEFNSFLKRLSNLSATSEIFALRTGNLITLRIDNTNLKMDVLLAMDN